MKALLKALTTSLILTATMIGTAQAGLMTIGTATYNGSEHNLIWDDNNNGNSVVWLDYTNGLTDWQSQKDWAAGLDGALMYNIDPGYTITWDDDDWRLPTTVDENDSIGYGKTNSEMGHLYNTGLGNGTGGMTNTGPTNTGDFQNLVATVYWSGTEYSGNTNNAWRFHFNDGYQDTFNKASNLYGMAVRSGQVATAAVPVPASVWLFGSGLVGLIGVSRRKRRHLALR